MKNKYILGIALVAIMVLSLVAFVPGAMAAKPTSTEPEQDYKGNGAPSGSHYTLNILGKVDTKDWDPSHLDNGKRIFVRLDKTGVVRTRILLVPAPKNDNVFKVLDADGTDGKAIFQLPDEYIGEEYAYYIYLRALGTPGGHVEIITATCDDTDGTMGCIEYNTIQVSRGNNGVAKFSEKSLELTTFGDYSLFHPSNLNYFWMYDNHGLRHLQMRFYPKPIPIV